MHTGSSKTASGTRRSVHRVLAWRVGLAGLLIGILFGGLTFVLEERRQGEKVLHDVLVGAKRFSHAAQDLLDEPGLAPPESFQERLEAFILPEPVEDRDGEFVLVGIYAPDGSRMASVRDEAHGGIDEIQRRVDDRERRLIEGEIGHAVRAEAGGRPYIDVVVPLLDGTGRTVARVEGVFAVSSWAMRQARRDALASVGAVLLVVLATTLLIYPIISTLLARMTRLNENLLDANLQTLQVLGGAVAKRDSDTDAHNYRVTLYSVRLGEEVGLPPREMQTLIKGAFLHDVGKIGIRDNVLLKPGKLTDEEFDTMKTHVNHGLEIAARSEWLSDAAAVVGFHHEKFSGGGYPYGLSGRQIPIMARVFAIADVFDALTSRRPYKGPLSLDDTMAILEEGRGTHFDPDLLDAFHRIAGSLFEEFGGREGDGPRCQLDELTRRYFGTDLADLLKSVRASTGA